MDAWMWVVEKGAPNPDVYEWSAVIIVYYMARSLLIYRCVRHVADVLCRVCI